MSGQRSLALLLVALGIPLSAWGQNCSEPRAVIEKLPYFDEWDNCGSTNDVGKYESTRCKLPDPYPAAEVVYELRLHEGNQVSFLLTPVAKDQKPAPDLALIVLDTCGDGSSCVSHSADFFGDPPVPPEEIAATSYRPPGVYYLNVDSAAGPCGHYKLSVLGVNPTPDLFLGLTASPRVTAGETLTYTFTTLNRGASASNVRLEPSLPPDMKLKKYSDGCELDGGRLLCRTATLLNGQENAWKVSITIEVPAGARGRITSSGKVQADAGGSAEAEATTVVNHRSDLSIQIDASPEKAVAGDLRTYTLTLNNDGPSDATDVKATVTLDDDEDLESHDGKVVGGQIVYEDLDLEADGQSQTRTFVVRIKSSAISSISHRATIGTETGTETDRGDNEDHLDTLISRETDLRIDSVTASRSSPGQSGILAAGTRFAYAIGVSNADHSDSSGGLVTLELPGYLQFQEPDDDCRYERDTEHGSLLVTCTTPYIAAKDRKVVKFSLETLPSLGAKSFHSEALVTPNENDPDTTNNAFGFDTDIGIEADLQFDGKLDATSSVCGGDILYTMKVVNRGPSDSPGGTVTDVLEGLSFVASPDGCTVASDNRTVTCPVDDLAVGAPPVEIRFRALPLAPGVVRNRASVQGEHDPTSDKSDVASTTVSPSADLELTLSASEDAVHPGQDFTYTVVVTNHGPSKAEGVKVEVTLPPGVTTDPACTACTLEIGEIEAHGTGEATLPVTAPAATGPLAATARLSNPGCNPAGASTAVATTTVAEEGDADLALTMTADRPVVSEGALLTYTIQVVNHGFGPAEDVDVRIDLAGGLTFESGEHCSSTENPPGVLCDAFSATLTVKVGSTDGSLLTTHAEFLPEPHNDLNKANNQLDVSTQQTAPLIVPFVDAARPTTTFTLKNPSSEQSLGLAYSLFLPGRSAEPVPLDLSPKAMAIVDVLASAALVEDGELPFGHVEITRLSGPEPPSGDFTLIDAARGAASGERLISRDTDLCGSWSVRFYNDQPAGSGTDLLFFVPDNPGDVVARGTVFSETGAFVEDLEVPLSQESYRYPVQVPAGSGSIEWTFSNGFAGSVTAIHRRSEGDEVAVPGFCHRSGNTPAESLILPWFQTNAAINTYVAVRNETDDEIEVHATYSGSQEPATFRLAGHAVRTANLRRLLADDKGDAREGFLEMKAFDPSSLEPVAALSGDFIRVGPDGLAGSALVEPTGFCRRWDTRFVQGGTSFLVFRENAGAYSVTLYKENGSFVHTQAQESQELGFRVAADELGLGNLAGAGSIEWDLGARGYVAMLLPGAGRSSVLIPGSCLPDEEPED